MSSLQRRIVFRWTSAPSLISIMILLASTTITVVFMIDYLAMRGLEYRVYQLDTLLTIPYLYLPLIGFLVFVISCWMYLTGARAIVVVKPGMRPPAEVLPVRMLEGAFLILTVLAGSLYLPYVFGSNWMLKKITWMRAISPELGGFVSWFYSNTLPLMALPPLWKYFASSLMSLFLVAATVLVVARGRARPSRRR
ncbi:hypothetical protein KEJ39_08400 [Candidatus Bathyarchaeota archaeon]|nr:hypothetical protein [Candidatus Bathyarchaeota archaeon]